MARRTIKCPACDVLLKHREGTYVHFWPEIWGFAPSLFSGSWLECPECSGVLLLPEVAEMVEAESRRLERLIYGL